jgi:tRNA threonylcarbamoyladenosine biosynthesis protein TsaB
MPVAEATARIAATKLGTRTPRPAPLYLRPADAAPARDTPPAIFS